MTESVYACPMPSDSYSINFVDLGEIVELSNGGLLPAHANVEYFAEDICLDLTMELNEEGKFVATRMVAVPGVNASPFTGSTLTSTRWRQIMNRITEQAGPVAAGRRKLMSESLPSASEPTLTFEERQTAKDLALGISRRRFVTDELLGEVAEIVLANRDAPTKAVQQQLSTGYRNASRWITEARNRGFLKED
jgi:hypothetical protein